MFDKDQLATWEEARELAKVLSAAPDMVGGGVLPESPDPGKSGIYMLDWYAGGAGFAEPQFIDKDGKKYCQLLFRFSNGAEGMSVGLIREMFKRYPTSPVWVKRRLAAEANMLAGGAAY